MRKAIVFSSLLTLAVAMPVFASDGNDSAARNQDSASAQGSNGSNDAERTVSYKAAASNLMDLNVQDSQGEDIGTVSDLLLDDDHDVTHLVISAGGMGGMGGRDVAVEIDQVEIQPENVIYNGTNEELEAMPEFAYAEETENAGQDQARVGEDTDGN